MRFYLTLVASALGLCLVFGSALCMAAGIVNDSNQPSVASEPASSGWTDTAHGVLINALGLTGIRYRYGGNSPETGFDCSGFVRYVFQQAASLTLPHGARALSQLGQMVPIEQLKPGDLVFFNTLKSAFSHVGIYLGDNRFIHAPSAGGGVHVVDMSDAYWVSRYNGARRIDTPQAVSPQNQPR